MASTNPQDTSEFEPGESAGSSENQTEQQPTPENTIGGGTPISPPSMTLQKAVELGEYSPEYLSTFPEWHNLSAHAQLQYIRQALDNRERQLVVQWAETANSLDFSQKPHLQEALRNIEAQRKKLMDDRDRLYIEYSRKATTG